MWSCFPRRNLRWSALREASSFYGLKGKLATAAARQVHHLLCGGAPGAHRPSVPHGRGRRKLPEPSLGCAWGLSGTGGALVVVLDPSAAGLADGFRPAERPWLPPCRPAPPRGRQQPETLSAIRHDDEDSPEGPMAGDTSVTSPSPRWKPTISVSWQSLLVRFVPRFSDHLYIQTTAANRLSSLFFRGSPHQQHGGPGRDPDVIASPNKKRAAGRCRPALCHERDAVLEAITRDPRVGGLLGPVSQTPRTDVTGCGAAPLSSHTKLAGACQNRFTRSTSSAGLFAAPAGNDVLAAHVGLP